MFAKAIIDSDAFLDMPLSTQALYFHLSMRADDDGFINNPKKVMRMVGASEDELKVLLTKRYLLGFDSGVIVIKHWRIHNYIRNDRYKETLYQEEMSLLEVKDNKSYTMDYSITNNEGFGIPKSNQVGTQMDTQVRLGKVSIGKDNNNFFVDSDEPNEENLTKSKFDEESTEYRLSLYLYNHMLKNNPQAKKPNFQTWAKQIDYMIRLDKRKLTDIKKVIEWSQKDSFWKANILSTKKLREKYDQLYVKMNNNTDIMEVADF